MEIEIIEIIKRESKKMGKFAFGNMYGHLVKYRSDFGEGHAYVLPNYGKEIEEKTILIVETLAKEVSDFRVIEKMEPLFYELENRCEYKVRGEIVLMYGNEDGNHDLIKIACGKWEFFLNRRDFLRIKVEVGKFVEFRVRELELYGV